MNPTPPLLLFDGVCNLCNGLVSFILRNEKEPQIIFAPLQSEHARKRLTESGTDSQSVVFIDNGVAYTKSKAVFMIARHLKFPWSWISFFRIFPATLTDFLYTLVSKHRYRFFGKRDTCMVPHEKWKHRFLI